MRSILDLKHTYYNGISLDQLNNLVEKIYKKIEKLKSKSAKLRGIEL